MPNFFRHFLTCLVPFGMIHELRAEVSEPLQIPEMTVLAERRTDENQRAIAAWDRQEMRHSAPRTLDELLAKEPAFSLYRRQTSLFGNPTSAGVSLRNTGATAASRTLVLLDGVPQNDPFGGWVYWARYQPLTLDSVKILPSASSAAWGNQSPAGAIHLTRRSPFSSGTTLEAGGGSQGTLQGALFHQITNAYQDRSASVSLFGLHSDGFFALDSSQRGRADRKLDLDLLGAEISFAQILGRNLVLEPTFSYYQEERGNGTQLSRNVSEALDFSLRLTSKSAENSEWQATLWQQRREFESVFSNVSANRETEIMALDQYDVPAIATGASWILKREIHDRWALHAGADIRQTRGETRENVGTFRNRVAGGEQTLAGIFAGSSVEIGSSTRFDLSGRLDFWEIRDGKRVETSLSNGAVLTDFRPKDREGVDPTLSAELTQRFSESLSLHVSAGTGFRMPTLNELYRPFRVRNDLTEANAELDPERFVSLESGLEWKPSHRFRAHAALFHHWISDAIANVPVTDAAEITEIFGSLPAGGTGAIRRNVEQARVLGIESGAEWKPSEKMTFALDGIYTETKFAESRGQPLLEEKPFSQAPDLKLIATAEWQITPEVSVSGGYEYGASQYDDALARRRIGDYTSARIGLRWAHGPAIYRIQVENLLDESIQTGLSSDNLRTYAAPRSVWAGISWVF